MPDLVPVMGMLTFWGAVVAIILVPRWLKSREREALQATLRAAIERGQSLPPEVVEAITREAKPKPSPARDLRTGVIWLSVAAGLVAFAYAVGYMSEESAEAFYPLLGIAAFPGFVGLAFLVLALLNRGKGRE